MITLVIIFIISYMHRLPEVETEIGQLRIGLRDIEKVHI